jgi:hypothetical protein
MKPNEHSKRRKEMSNWPFFGEFLFSSPPCCWAAADPSITLMTSIRRLIGASSHLIPCQVVGEKEGERRVYILPPTVQCVYGFDIEYILDR